MSAIKATAQFSFPALDDAIALYLRRNNMTQADFAADMEMSENTLSWKRRGVREWTLSEAVKACRIVGITLDAAVAQPAHSRAAAMTSKPSALERLANLKRG